MPRAHRIQAAGAVYHITARGNRRQDIFHDAADYQRFLEFLGAVVRRFGWQCHAYCLMPNHFHLLVETPEPNISAGMQLLNGSYAQWFNWRRGFTGHLFQGRFHDRLVESPYHALELARYVVLNPVRAGLCERASDWRWSSYRAVVGEASSAVLTVSWLLSQFGPTADRARESYRRFVLDAAARPRPP